MDESPITGRGVKPLPHANAPPTIEGRRLRLVERCRTRPIAHVAREVGSLARNRVEVGQPLPKIRCVRLSSPGVAVGWRLGAEERSQIALALEQEGIGVSRRTVS